MSLSDFSEELIAIAHALAEAGNGILAVDESTKTVGKRLGSISIKNTELNR
jgi:fructose-bisphosphate aldolase class I